MKALRRILLVLCLAVGVSLNTFGHGANNFTVYEGEAGPYPVRVDIHLPGVVPGLAGIHVRVLTNGVRKVTVLPVHWQTGVEGAPPPDVAQPVSGDPGLYVAQLWLMTGGSYSVFVNVEGTHGSGETIVPVASIATSRKEMPEWLGAVLLTLGGFLLFSALSIVGAAVRESVLEPGTSPSAQRRWFARGAIVVAFLAVGSTLAGGRYWWNQVDKHHRENRLYDDTAVSAEAFNDGGRRLLQIHLDDPTWGRRDRTPLVPDHGKLMHVFLLRQPGLDAFAHLHPLRHDDTTFEAILPPLPPGEYEVYVDVTRESGLAESLFTVTELPEAPPAGTPIADPDGLQPDPEDSWLVSKSFVSPRASGAPVNPLGVVATEPMRCELGNGLTMIWENPSSQREQDTTLTFKVVDASGQPTVLEPYMGMMGHLALRRADGQIFAHVHPSGTVSTASQLVFQLRAQGRSPRMITAAAQEKFCKLPPVGERRLSVGFPFQFTEAGDYRVWVQVRVRDRVLTGVFDTSVVP